MLMKFKVLLDRCLEWLVILSMGILVIDVLWQVFTRYVSGYVSFIKPSDWTEELAIFLLIWVALLGAAVALNRGAHLGIDYFVGKLKARTRIYTEALVFVSIASFSLTVMVWGGLELVQTILHLEQKSPALGWQMGYVYLAVPISGVFMALYSLLAMWERLKALDQKEDRG